MGHRDCRGFQLGVILRQEAVLKGSVAMTNWRAVHKLLHLGVGVREKVAKSDSELGPTKSDQKWRGEEGTAWCSQKEIEIDGGREGPPSELIHLGKKNSDWADWGGVC